MKIARLAGLMLVAVLALGLVAASAAFAGPEFKPAKGTFTGTSGLALLVAGGEKVDCTADTSSGTISSATLAGGVVVHFTGCTSYGTGGNDCSVSSKTSGVAGNILTSTLHGVLGTILPSGRAGLLLLPVSGKQFLTLLKNNCTIETSVTGNLVGEVTPVGKSQKTGKLVFATPNPTDFDPSTGGLTEPGLTAFSATASEETTEELTFSETLEVT